jgi:hypothetical protein
MTNGERTPYPRALENHLRTLIACLLMLATACATAPRKVPPPCAFDNSSWDCRWDESSPAK